MVSSISTFRSRQAWRRKRLDVSKITNLQAHVVKRAAPRYVSSFARRPSAHRSRPGRKDRRRPRFREPGSWRDGAPPRRAHPKEQRMQARDGVVVRPPSVGGRAASRWILGRARGHSSWNWDRRHPRNPGSLIIYPSSRGGGVLVPASTLLRGGSPGRGAPGLADAAPDSPLTASRVGAEDRPRCTSARSMKSRSSRCCVRPSGHVGRGYLPQDGNHRERKNSEAAAKRREIAVRFIDWGRPADLIVASSVEMRSIAASTRCTTYWQTE